LLKDQNNWYDLLIIASIIEKEERVDANRKKIA
jgi:cell division protein YceG involved in septum cleavage